MAAKRMDGRVSGGGEMMTGIYDQIESQELKFPERVRCAHCGQMATFEEFDSDPDDWILGVYLCYTCSWWTEWEIMPRDDGSIRSSTLFHYSFDRDDVTIGDEARGWPGYWKPDGFTVPDEALNPIEVE